MAPQGALQPSTRQHAGCPGAEHTPRRQPQPAARGRDDDPARRHPALRAALWSLRGCAQQREGQQACGCAAAHVQRLVCSDVCQSASAHAGVSGGWHRGALARMCGMWRQDQGKERGRGGRERERAPAPRRRWWGVAGGGGSGGGGAKSSLSAFYCHHSTDARAAETKVHVPLSPLPTSAHAHTHTRTRTRTRTRTHTHTHARARTLQFWHLPAPNRMMTGLPHAGFRGAVCACFKT